ncbi:MAG: HPP family protein [Cocleimonas sp.]|nr:HPP family protein [Cocleimonas sp.]
MRENKPLISQYKDGSAQFGIFDVDIKGKYNGRWGGFSRYIIQSFIAGCFVSIMVFGLLTWKGDGEDSLVRYLILSSIGASTFLVFGAPRLGTSAPLKVFFGHFIAVIIGISIFFLRYLFFGESGLITIYEGFELASLLAVSLATFWMIVLNFEHPPAAGTALALSIYITPDGRPPENIFIMAAFILIAAFLLGCIHRKFYMKDGIKAMTGIDDGTLSQLKLYRNKEGENSLLTIQGLAKANPVDIYRALGENAIYFCHKKVDSDNFKTECCPIFQMWIDQAKDQTIKEQGYSKWTLRDLF